MTIEGFSALDEGFTNLVATGTTTVRTTGNQDYFNAVTLSNSQVLDSTASGTITVHFTVDALNAGVQSLTIMTNGTAVFGAATLPAPTGVVGGTTPLKMLTVEGNSPLSAGTIDLNALAPAGKATVTTQGGGQDYKGGVTLSAAAILDDTTGPITFESTVTGATFDLTTATTGLTTFEGAVSECALKVSGPAVFETAATVSAVPSPSAAPPTSMRWRAIRPCPRLRLRASRTISAPSR